MAQVPPQAECGALARRGGGTVLEGGKSTTLDRSGPYNSLHTRDDEVQNTIKSCSLMASS